MDGGGAATADDGVLSRGDDAAGTVAEEDQIVAGAGIDAVIAAEGLDHVVAGTEPHVPITADAGGDADHIAAAAGDHGAAAGGVEVDRAAPGDHRLPRPPAADHGDDAGGIGDRGVARGEGAIRHPGTAGIKHSVGPLTEQPVGDRGQGGIVEHHIDRHAACDGTDEAGERRTVEGAHAVDIGLGEDGVLAGDERVHHRRRQIGVAEAEGMSKLVQHDLVERDIAEAEVEKGSGTGGDQAAEHRIFHLHDDVGLHDGRVGLVREKRGADGDPFGAAAEGAPADADIDAGAVGHLKQADPGGVAPGIGGGAHDGLVGAGDEVGERLAAVLDEGGGGEAPGDEMARPHRAEKGIAAGHGGASWLRNG